MSTPNPLDAIERLSTYLDTEDMMEGRFENDGDGNPIYVGYSPIPNANPALPVWYIFKVTYVAEAAVRKQLPDDGPGFIYVWNDRASLFS